MPIYEYECPNCGRHYELIQRFSDEPLYSCPECGGHVHKLISHSSFILKGSGLYVTDYASHDRKKGKVAKSKPDDKTESKADSTTKK
jgi:putative FmdB family regulatory protein